MDEEVWRGLDLQLPANGVAGGLHGAADGDAIHDPFWPALADCTSSFFASDDINIAAGSAPAGRNKAVVAEDMVLDVDTSCFMAVAEHQQQDLLMMNMNHDQIMYYSSSSPSSSTKRSLSIDSAGSSPFSFDAALAPPTTTFPSTTDPFAGDDAAIMRAMMAVLSSASPSSSESSSPPHWRHESSSSSLPVYPPCGVDNNNNNGVLVRSTSLPVAPPEKKQHDDATRSVPGSSSNNSSQVYHMMSERKRREKLNDSFQTLRSLLPPCSKKDKTTVLVNAASYLKKLEAEVSELEEKNAKLERHVPREDGGAATTRAAEAAAHRRAKVQVSRAPSSSDAADQVNLTVMVMVECDIVDLVLHVLERLRWMAGVSVLSVDADTYSPQVLLKAIASIKLQITDGDCWNEASFHEAMKKVVHDATSPFSCASAAPLVLAA